MGWALELLGNKKEAEIAYKDSLQKNPVAIRATKYISGMNIKDSANPNHLVSKKKQGETSRGKEKSKKKEEVHPVEQIRQAVGATDVESLKKEYYEKKLDQKEDSFVLVRIIGNDLYPRHKKGQSRENVKFILDNEPAYDGCDKLWIVNRIVDSSERDKIISMLKAYDQEYVETKFSEDEYLKIPLETDILPSPGFLNSKEYQELGPEQQARVITAIHRLKNNYVMNNNGARNMALKEGKKRAKWVLPWDGNCYLTPAAWKEIYHDVTQEPWYRHFVVPMARVLSNDDLIQNSMPPDPVEEPQLIFRDDTQEEFNSNFCYGRRPKVELFWSLGIPGKWDRWKDDPWDQQRRGLLPKSRQFGLAGWVARLYSGMGSLEQDSQESFKNRGLVRQEAVISTLREIDKRLAGNAANKNFLQIYNKDAINSFNEFYKKNSDEEITNYIEELVSHADDALIRGPYSVVDKTTLPPSGDVHDYWHPAPYWWPDPSKSDGLPYIRRDGERVPGTRMYEPDSDKYDRTRIQRVFDDSITLALAWEFTGSRKYLDHAEKILKYFFIDTKTRMTPHLNYAQVRLGRNKNMGASTGLIEFKDFYYYLDAVRVLESSGYVSAKVFEQFRKWLAQYQQWLIDSPQGKKEILGHNNHGTYYDLQLAAVSAYLGDEKILYETFARAQGRIVEQIMSNGEQPDELSRATSQHYCHYNLQGFLNLALLARNWGCDLFNYTADNGASLKKAVDWLLQRHGEEWQYQQIDKFDYERTQPIYLTARELGYSARKDMGLQSSIGKTKFFPHDGVMPYFNFALTGADDDAAIFVVSRQDGLGNRLRAILNAIILSKAYGVDYKFIWEERIGRAKEHNVIEPAENVFDHDFISNHIVSSVNKSNEVRLQNYLKKDFPLIDGESAYIVEAHHAVGRFSHEIDSRNFITQHEAFRAVGFSVPVKSVLFDKQLKISSDFIAIHVRGGDIVYGNHKPNMETFYAKATPWPLVMHACEKIKAMGFKPLLICQDLIAEKYFNKVDGAAFASEFKIGKNYNDLLDAFADIKLMSQCAKIIAPNSGFSTLASFLNDAERIELTEFVGKNVIMTDDDINDVALVCKEQAAYCYLCLSLADEANNDFEGALSKVVRSMFFDDENLFFVVRFLYLNYMMHGEIFGKNHDSSIDKTYVEQNKRALLNVVSRLKKHGLDKYQLVKSVL